MVRYRRYRVFVAFAVIALFSLYHLSHSSASNRDASLDIGLAKGPKAKAETITRSRPRPHVAQETKKIDLDIPIAKASLALQQPPAITPASRPSERTPPPAPKPTANPNQDTEGPPEAGEAVHQTRRSSTGPDHWKSQSQLFPVPASKIIKLPTGKPKAIPKIQHAFKRESPTAKADREAKLNVIKGVFKRSWDGYREYAWLQDELSPVSGKFRNPFASWGATLVDTLDTLWIMGMKAEFEEAVKAVDKIDFTTTPRADIPMFETTIRYLGGLLAAYDLSDRKYENLLTKAVELAEVLISAFDTPNRMPQTYYYWRSPATSSYGDKRASSRVVLAEIGSLSVEFTRLAQLTGEHKYYDAIARITDNLEQFQNRTTLPGMWPTYLDASGCTIVRVNAPLQDAPSKAKTPHTPSAEDPLSPNGKKYVPLDLPAPVIFKAEPAAAEPRPEVKNPAAISTEEPLSPNGKKYVPLDLPAPVVFKAETSTEKKAPVLGKRQLENAEVLLEEDSVTPTQITFTTSLSPSPSPIGPKCEDLGFTSSPGGSEEYTLGGMSDSTYEYLPKEWLLLGGQVEAYRSMYEKSIDVVKSNLLFRPMLPGNDDILFSGKLFVPPSAKGKNQIEPTLEAENAHLTCFAGGMFGMGAKIFNRPEDLEIAKKLTEGCIWSYSMTATGIMPESFLTVPCESMEHCEWNSTKYGNVIDPHAEERLSSYELQLKNYKKDLASASAWYESELAAMTAPATKLATGVVEAVATPTPKLLSRPHKLPTPTTTPASDPLLGQGLPVGEVRRVEMYQEKKERGSQHQKRQLDIDIDNKPVPKTIPGWKAPGRNPLTGGKFYDGAEAYMPPTPVQRELDHSVNPDPALPVFPSVYSPAVPLTHEEYIQRRIKNDRLLPGVTRFQSRTYILRPEAIESVWYMYRITGDPHWREAGWRMFEAVNKHTATVYGNSAIDDVTKTSPILSDEMESFWLAETLKYFYLLFADEDVINLDEWVLNTEAHPFRRPT